MDKLLYISCFLFAFFVALSGCKPEIEIPDIPINPNPLPIQPETNDSIINETPDSVPGEMPNVPNKGPVEYPFVVTAGVGEWYFWNENDTLFAYIDENGSETCISLNVDSISEDRKTAIFTHVLDFEPTEETKWNFIVSPQTEDFSVQSGKADDLQKYIGLSASASGKSPNVNMKYSINVLKLILPSGTKEIYSQGGFASTINLEKESLDNDVVYFAVPETGKSSFSLSLKDALGSVFRNRYISYSNCLAENPCGLEISFLKHQNVTAEVLAPFKSRLKGNFSGITWIGDNLYAVADDNVQTEGWYYFSIFLSDKGDIVDVSPDEFVSSGLDNRDIEGITYNPTTGKMWLVGENDNVITEHYTDGIRTGNMLDTSMYTVTEANSGIEALTYNDETGKYWTTTEVGLEKDGGVAAPNNVYLKKHTLRLQSYLRDGTVDRQWFYETDNLTKNTIIDAYSFGVPSICALDDGRLLVLEREILIRVQVGEIASSIIKIYLVNPTNSPEGTVLSKKKIVELENNVVLSVSPTSFKGDFYNFEGMCLGPRQDNGDRILIMVSDSQGGLSFIEGDKAYSFPDTFLPIILQYSE